MNRYSIAYKYPVVRAMKGLVAEECFAEPGSGEVASWYRSSRSKQHKRTIANPQHGGLS